MPDRQATVDPGEVEVEDQVAEDQVPEGLVVADQAAEKQGVVEVSLGWAVAVREVVTGPADTEAQALAWFLAQRKVKDRLRMRSLSRQVIRAEAS
jgi:hypothetical protein